MSHADADRRRASAAERRRRRYEQAVQQELRIADLEQRAYAKIAFRHEASNDFCKSVAIQIREGRKVSRRQAAVLMRIDSKNRFGPPLPTQETTP